MNRGMSIEFMIIVRVFMDGTDACSPGSDQRCPEGQADLTRGCSRGQVPRQS